MRTIKIKFNSINSGCNEGFICYYLNLDGQQNIINTDYKIFRKEWNCFQQSIKIPSIISTDSSLYLDSLQKKIEKDFCFLSDLVQQDNFENSKSLTYQKDTYYIHFCENLIVCLLHSGKIRTAQTYQTALNSFKRFLGAVCDVPFAIVNQNLMLKYEEYLHSNNICQNSSSFYMRNLRAMYNRAVEQGITNQKYPFKQVYTGIGKTVKRAISLKVVRKIKNMEIVNDKNLEFARDIFMFSFYTRGMSFVDMAFLRKDNLHNGILTYRRQKTNQKLIIKWEKQMQEIIEKYDTSNTPYLLPIIRDINKDVWRQYKSSEHLVNMKLKKIGQDLGLSQPLTTYVARHAWASIANSRNIPISIISEAMGHDSEKTTRIYLASLDTSKIDKANKFIIKLL